MDTVDTQTLAALAQSRTREQFVAMLPHCFLILQSALYERDTAISTSTIDAIADNHPSSPRSSPNINVLEISKAAGNPYPDRISVGRARNCDIVMRDSSVSKL